MRQPHKASELGPVAKPGKSAHLGFVANLERTTQMFVRAVWRNQRLVDVKQTLREMELPTSRDAILFGLAAKDFAKMTRGLFDR
jgi:hypothetical protein